MIELIGIAACLLGAISVPFQVKALVGGSAFAAAPEKRGPMIRSMRRQFAWLCGFGVVLGLILLALAVFVEKTAGGQTVKAFGGVLWLLLAAECQWGRRRLAALPAVAP